MQRTSRMLRTALIAALMATCATPALADFSFAACTITPPGEAVEPARRDCIFSQRQGFIDIRFEDDEALFLSLTPTEGAGNFKDINGKPAYRQKGLGSEGEVFETEIGLVRVYWGR